MAKLIDVSVAMALSVVVYALLIFSVRSARDISSDNAPAEALSPDLPRTCRLLDPCINFVGTLLITRNMPRQRDFACCRDIVHVTKDCWEKIMVKLDERSYPNLHPWAENVWDKCVNIANSPAQAPLVADSPVPMEYTFPAKCDIPEDSSQFLKHLMLTKTLPTKKDVAFCKDVVKSTKFCWERTMELLENPNLNDHPLTNLHPWAENTWNTCVSLAN